jgi:hypothetical protein
MAMHTQRPRQAMKQCKRHNSLWNRLHNRKSAAKLHASAVIVTFTSCCFLQSCSSPTWGTSVDNMLDARCRWPHALGRVSALLSERDRPTGARQLGRHGVPDDNATAYTGTQERMWLTNPSVEDACSPRDFVYWKRRRLQIRPKKSFTQNLRQQNI